MFEGRLRILLVLWVIPAAAVTARLVQLQVVRGEQYRREAAQMLERRPRYFPCLRGAITDRAGRVLAGDAPAWDVCVRYDVIARDAGAGRPGEEQNPSGRAAGAGPGGADGPIDPCWEAIAALSGTPVEELLERARRIRDQVARIREAVSERRGVETPVAEEEMAHPVVQGLDEAEQVEASLRLADYPSVEVLASNRRTRSADPSMAHLLGQVIEVDAAAIRDDPWASDDLARYRPGDRHGVSGAEALGEPVLRGRRGRIHEDRAGRPLSEPVAPVHGGTFRLTLDAALQAAVYDRLAEAVEATPFRTGGCAVLLHIPTGRILAMVDYPAVEAWAPATEPASPIEGARQSRLFRAVRAYYPPGSTVKPMLMAAALAEGLATPDTEITCYGRLFIELPDRWRCTGTHWAMHPVPALQHSCNVFFFHMAERLGVPRLVTWMRRFGLGQPTGVSLPGERPGRLPERTLSRGAARNLGIGQGTLDVTPLQVANMMATLASGRLRPVTLWEDDPAPAPAADLPVPASAWRVVREGMYKAVNEAGGTAWGDARGTLADPDFVLLGKTGSAEVPRGRTIETRYVLHLPDGRVQEIVAPDLPGALAQADCPAQDRERIVVAGFRSHRRYPPDPPEPYTHAWFTGYLAPRDRPVEAVRSGEAAVAIAVVIEFAGHGGDVAAPVARDMLRQFLAHLRDGAASGGGGP